jgi:hypothetical protein
MRHIETGDTSPPKLTPAQITPVPTPPAPYFDSSRIPTVRGSTTVAPAPKGIEQFRQQTGVGTTAPQPKPSPVVTSTLTPGQAQAEREAAFTEQTTAKVGDRPTAAVAAGARDYAHDAGLDVTLLGITKKEFDDNTTAYNKFINVTTPSIDQYNSISKGNLWSRYDWGAYKSDKYGTGMDAYKHDIADLVKQRQDVQSNFKQYQRSYTLYVAGKTAQITGEKKAAATLETLHIQQQARQREPEYIQHVPLKWNLEYYQDGKKYTRTFDSEYDANEFAKRVASEVPQVAAMLNLVRQGLAKETADGRYILTKPETVMTDRELAIVKEAGFPVSDPITTPSWNIYQWGQKYTKPETVQRNLTDLFAAEVGNFQDAAVSVYRTVGTLIGGPNSRGANEEWREVTTNTLGYLRNLTPDKQNALSLAGLGGSFLGAYVGMLPIGVVASGVFQAAREIVSATGFKLPVVPTGAATLTTSQQIVKIADEIASHPRLAQALIWAPQVGMDTAQVYADYKAGKPTYQILGEEATRAGTALGGYAGLSAGMKIPTQIKQIVDTFGKKFIPPQIITDPEDVVKGLLDYKAKNYWGRVNEFNQGSTFYAAEDYLGELPPGMKRLWHGTPEVWQTELGGETTIENGVFHKTKLGGLYLADAISPLRIGGEGAEEAARIGLPAIRGAPQAIAVDAYLGTIPDNISKLSNSEIRAWFEEQAGKQTAYLPPQSMMTAEREANIPRGSRLLNMGDDWYTNDLGQRVLISKYALLPDEVADKMVSAGLGSKIVGVDDIDWVSPSSVKGKTTYLAFGISPASVGYSGLTSLSGDQVSYLSKQYGISESEVRSISSSLAGSMSQLSSSLSETSTRSSLAPTSTRITAPEPSSTIRDDSKSGSSYAPKPGVTIYQYEGRPSPTSTPTPSSTPTPTPTPTPIPTPPPPTGGKPTISGRETQKLAQQLRTKYNVVYEYRRGRGDEWIGIANNYIDANSKAESARKRKGIEIVGATYRILQMETIPL